MLAGRVIFDGPQRELFADSALISRAGLRKPPIAEVGERLGLGWPLLRVDDVVLALSRRPVHIR
jgi:hypothetical protein